MASPALGRPPVLDLLADGDWHSGVALASTLGLSRAAVWKQIGVLRMLGLSVATDRRHGYRLGQPLELLAETRIRALLSPETQAVLDSLEIPAIISSTNEHLAGQVAPSPGRMRVLLAEYQSGGRGRRGRRWLSPFAHGICLSVAWTFETAPRDLPLLSLVAGVSVMEALDSLKIGAGQLKWPNDIVAAGGKLGGILVEVSGEPGGPLRAVIGVGLNVRPLTTIARDIDLEGGVLPAVALDDLADGRRIGRNQVTAALLDALHAGLQAFTRGSRIFLESWRRYDSLAGKPVLVSAGQQSVAGIARGIADDGSLLVETEGGIVPVVAGDVTLRANRS